MKLRIIKGDDPGREYEVTGDTFTIGREVDNDMVINETSVSRRHCQLHKEGDTWMVEDLHSMNGVRINGKKIDGGAELYDGDVISVYDWDIMFTTGTGGPVRLHTDGTPKGAEGEKKVPFSSPDSKPESDENADAPAGRIVKIVLLVIVLALIVMLAFLILRGRDGKAPDAKKPTKESAPAAAVKDQGNSMLLPEELDNLKATPRQSVAQDDAETTTPPSQSDNTTPQPPAQPLSGLVLFESIPPNAEVLLDGTSVGRTPLVLRDVPTGRHNIELRKQGYEDFLRQIQVPDKLPSMPSQLVLKAGVVSIETEPAGAWVWEGRRLCGVTPLLMEGLAEGEHEFIVNGPGCEGLRKTVNITPARGESLKLQLTSRLGGLNITGCPPDCKVLINGYPMGTTQPDDANPLVSKPFEAESLLAGQFVLKIEHSSGVAASGPVVITPGKIAQVGPVKLWIPTHSVTLVDGTTLTGKLLEKNEHDDVVIQLPNMSASRYLKPQIANIRELTVEEIKREIASIKKGRGAAAIAPAFGRRDDYDMSTHDFLQKFESTSEQTFNTLYNGKQLCLKGASTARLKENGLIIVQFGFKLRCVFTPGTPESDYNAISNASDRKQDILVRGICEGVRNGVILMNSCTLVSE